MRIVRDYEVSIWTLQDSFITVLKPYGIELKGQLQEPDLKIVDDGTIEFTFNLPMYYTLNGERLKNPLWDNIINGTIVANMRKAKIIFKKHQQGEKVIELMITKVTESHDKDQLMCEVSCEGLAFHELGKIGYKIALETDDLIEENTEWFKGNMSDPEPRGTLQYWNDKVFKLASGNWKWNWTYEIQMDYSNNPGKDLHSDKVYEDAYVSSWDYNASSDMVVAQAYVDNAEKERVVDLKESNVYNLTQDLAKTFGVFCRYEYDHDENYHICGRKVIYYNNFLFESLGALDITYPYDTSVISRTSDSTDLVTKLYIQTDGSNNDGEPITITNSSANKTREDYILNFDYLWRTGAITQEQYAAARQFEIDVYRINNELIPIQNQIIALEAEIPELEAKVTIRKNSITLDQERMSAADDLLNALTDNTGILEVTNLNPKTGIIITSKKTDGSKETYANITELGIDIKTLKVYKNYNSGTHVLSDIYSFTPIFDEFQNLIQLRDFNLSLEENDSPRIYMTYQYAPDLYYERVKQIWQQRMANDTVELQNAEDRLEEIDHLLNGYEDDEEVYHEGYYEKRDALIEEKNLAISRLERVMGAALREGYWQPEDYNDYGDKHLDQYTISNTIAYIDASNNKYGYLNDLKDAKVESKFIYDTVSFDEEQKGYMDSFTIDNQDTTINYPCIKIEGEIASFIQAHPDNFSFIFYDVTDLDPNHRINKYRKIYHIGSQCQYVFMNNNGTIIPVIMITGAINDYLTSRVLKAMIGRPEGNDNAEPCLAIIDPLTAKITGTTQAVTANDWLNPGTAPNYDQFGETVTAYPRIQITSLNIRTDNDEILVKYKGHNLENYEDYQLLIRDNSYYINLKPEIFARYGFSGSGQIQYIVSNANTMIYLDALQVSKENSQPKVEYSVTVNAINQDFIEEDYNYLGYIAHINDTDLKFENVYGYVSELHLKLDKPWEDEVTIKNYKTKFEDLFTSIVAQTEQMQKNSTTIGNVGALFDAKGDLIPSSIEKGINKLDLTEAFNKGTLTWDDAEGLWASSDSGVVAIRGGGIFAATQKNPDGSWHWNTGLTPEGINADLITTGQLDTNRIKVYAGDELRLQLNADGLFAYKTGWDGEIKTDDVVDYKQYVVHDASGLFLIAENGAQYKDNKFLDTTEVDEEQKPTTYAGNVGLHNHKDGSLERVAISWDGLTLRNWAGEKVFYADPDNGNLKLEGALYATSLYIGKMSDETSTNLLTNNGKIATNALEDAAVITKAANLTIDNTTGQILLSAAKFDHLGENISNSGIYLDPDQIKINSNGQLSINTANLIIDSTAIGTNSILELKKKSSDWTELNNNYDTALKYSITNGLEITGAITATSFILSSGATVSGLSYNDLTDKPSIPDPSSYVINGLSMTSWGNTTPKTNYLALTSEGGLLFGANNGIVIPRFTPVSMDDDATNNDDMDNTDVVMAINGEGIQFNHYKNNEVAEPDSYIRMNSDGISLSGSNIEINSKPIWSHENIIIMNPNAEGQDAWRRTVPTITAAMSGKHDWVLIQPYYDATINYISTTGLQFEGEGTGTTYFSASYPGVMKQDGTNAAAFGSTDWYTYSLQLRCRGPQSPAGLTVSNFLIYLSNTPLTNNNFQADAQLVLSINNSNYSTTTNPITYFNLYGWAQTTENIITTTVKRTGEGGTPAINLCGEDSIIYFYLYLTGNTANYNGSPGTITNRHYTIYDFALTCTTDATVGRVPCTVYYYP